MTRNFYVLLSRWVQAYLRAVTGALLLVALGGFALLAASVATVEESGQVANIGGRLWFSASGLLAVVVIAGYSFNPSRDLASRAVSESWQVALLNLMLCVAVWPWFWGD